jgi:serine/threonine protein kinase/tetratricopeptide (TPR) repeat protein
VELRDRLQSSLGTTYTLERKLGGGGMSRVFVAEEARLGRKVVVKVLSPELAADISAERFEREIKLAASLQQANIVPVLTAGDTAGVPYYTMPFVEGEGLGARLRNRGAMSISEVVSVLRDVARALAYAHERGIVHRDIKPDNVLLSGGAAVVTDFGIAKAISVSRTHSDSATLTQLGTAIGTPAYISPEQAAGDPDVDHRADIYSFGCMAYEMLTGQPPFANRAPQRLMAAHISEQPQQILEVRADMPPALAAMVMRCLEKDASARPQTATELIAALDPTITSDTTLDRTNRSPDPAPRGVKAPERSIAVLPFTNSSGDADSEYFSDGITEEIINAIARLPGVRVAARTSSFSFKGKPIDIALVGERLNVATVLEGSVRRAGGRVRITTQLISVIDGYQLWSERYDRGFDDIFAIQDDIARSIVEHLRVTLAGSSDQVLVARGTDNVDAYDLYLRGRHFWRRRGPELATAIDYFARAIAADPDFAAPHAGLADCHSLMAAYGYQSSAAAFERARSAAYRALALDPSAGESHAAVGLFELWMGWDLEVAKRELHRASEANPSWAVPLCWLGQLAVALGRDDEARAAANRARQVEPLSPLTAFIAAGVLVWSRSFVDAAAAAARAIELDPSFSPGYLAVGWVHHHNGRYDEAIAAFRRFAELSSRCPFALAPLGCALADIGCVDEARSILNELEARGADAWYLGQLYWKLGQEDQAFSLFDRAVREHNAGFYIIARVPGLERMIRDPRWFALLQKAGLRQVASVFEVQR